MCVCGGGIFWHFINFSLFFLINSFLYFLNEFDTSLCFFVGLSTVHPWNEPINQIKWNNQVWLLLLCKNLKWKYNNFWLFHVLYVFCCVFNLLNLSVCFSFWFLETVIKWSSAWFNCMSSERNSEFKRRPGMDEWFRNSWLGIKNECTCYLNAARLYYAKDLWEEFSAFYESGAAKEAQNSLSPHVSLIACATQSPPSKHTCEGWNWEEQQGEDLFVVWLLNLQRTEAPLLSHSEPPTSKGWRRVSVTPT